MSEQFADDVALAFRRCNELETDLAATRAELDRALNALMVVKDILFDDHPTPCPCETCTVLRENGRI